MAQRKVYNATTKQYVTLEVNDDKVDETASLEDSKKDCRLERNILLKDCDWALGPDSPLTDAQKTEVTEYRDKLRNFPATADFPNGALPTKPDFL